ncbi:NfeD family protein [Desulfosarcina cetonica]
MDAFGNFSGSVDDHGCLHGTCHGPTNDSSRQTDLELDLEFKRNIDESTGLINRLSRPLAAHRFPRWLIYAKVDHLPNRQESFISFPIPNDRYRSERKENTMNLHIAYWHWLVFGMILIMTEIFIPSFTIFWFGLGAIVVSGLMLMDNTLSFSWQLFIWAIASCIFTFLWFKYIRPIMTDRTKAGIPREAAIGEVGQVIRRPESGRRGMVRFTTPLLGSEEWTFICSTDVTVGDRVKVTDVSGNTLMVNKL